MGKLWPTMMPLSGADDDSICLVGASGHRIRFADGNTALCGTSGLWNVNLGYGNQAIAQRVEQTLRTLSYGGVFRFENGPAREAAERLADASAHDFERVIFSVSGGTANDLVMKLARQYHEIGGEPARKIIVGLKSGYHGLTFGAHALTGEDLGQRGYGIDTRLVRHVPPNDETALRFLFRSLGQQIAAVVVEPVLGNGTVVLEPDYVACLGALADEFGTLLVADEVATGFGRTGPMFASDLWQRQPDVLITSKGLTNGTMPASALLVRDRIAERFSRFPGPLLHGETQGGTAVTSAAILATLDEFERLDAVSAGKTAGDALASALTGWQSEDPGVLETRGAGCFRSVVLTDPLTESTPLEPRHLLGLVEEIRRTGARVHPGPSGIQLIPALTYTADEIHELVSTVRAGIASYAREARKRAGTL
ncbi:daptide-type RiPP biosynthesis aminotransferase [Streptomyces sp. NPDC056534]|uniref:daptide-type RiPP biosynthesis aminotransferase n=1 Tax=Streptomyces sp. NPDC056534 TaxID=3345857 RepID=UPI0036855261